MKPGEQIAVGFTCADKSCGCDFQVTFVLQGTPPSCITCPLCGRRYDLSYDFFASVSEGRLAYTMTPSQPLSADAGP